MRMANQPRTAFDRAAAQYIVMIANSHKPRITQTELGRRAGIPPASMGKYWRGDIAMTLGTFQKICEVLGVPWDTAMDAIEDIAVALEKSEGK